MVAKCLMWWQSKTRDDGAYGNLEESGGGRGLGRPGCGEFDDRAIAERRLRHPTIEKRLSQSVHRGVEPLASHLDDLRAERRVRARWIDDRGRGVDVSGHIIEAGERIDEVGHIGSDQSVIDCGAVTGRSGVGLPLRRCRRRQPVTGEGGHVLVASGDARLGERRDRRLGDGGVARSRLEIGLGDDLHRFIGRCGGCHPISVDGIGPGSTEVHDVGEQRLRRDGGGRSRGDGEGGGTGGSSGTAGGHRGEISGGE